MTCNNFLYHGSSSKVEILNPHNAQDTLVKKNMINAIYATENYDLALLYALGEKKDPETGKLFWFTRVNTHGKVEKVFINGQPNTGEKGYIYVLPKIGFIKISKNEWINTNSVKPMQIIEIYVNDYLFLCRKANEKEITKFTIYTKLKEVLRND